MYRKLVATRSSQKFREVVTIQSMPLPVPGAGQLLVRNKFLGINASDINFTAGRYFDVENKFPKDLGFESVGEVAAIGTDCSRGYKLGDAVGVFVSNGTFSEYMVVQEDHVIPFPQCIPAYLPLIASGLTASIALQCVGEVKRGDKVLVTAAAGGTGQLAVQLAKAVGCHVIGTCSSEEKMKLLRELGCDRPVNYKEESLQEVLCNEYPQGVDVVYESVGGEMFATCVNNLAVKGRLIIIGAISKYQNDTVSTPIPVSAMDLLFKSASIRGFCIAHYLSEYTSHLAKMMEMVKDDKLKCAIDNGKNHPGGPFVGLEAISDAVEYLHSGKNCGKVFVQLNHSN